MLDIQFIRDNKENVQKNAQNKGYDVDINRLLELDQRKRDLQQNVEQLRHERNELSQKLKGGGKPDDKDIQKGKELKENIQQLEEEFKPVEEEYTAILKAVPNMALKDVPVGASEDENQVFSQSGQKPEFEFEPKSHWELGEQHDWIDKERAAKVSGSRFAYLKGDFARLQLAIMNWVVDELTHRETIQDVIAHAELDSETSDEPFTFILPPAMLRTDVFDAMDRLEPRDDRYQVGFEEDDLWLQGSAEHTIGSMYMNEIIDVTQSPKRYLGYSSSFRREAGTYGKDTEGIIRMHQFDKLEMESFSSAKQGLSEHKLMVALQVHLVEKLELPYQILQKCTADIGKPNASGWDIEVWFPSQEKYRETHTADYMTDYQARRLNTRYRNSEGQLEFIHTNDATAFALGRIMAAIIENYQQADAGVVIPKVLQKYINKEVIRAR